MGQGERLFKRTVAFMLCTAVFTTAQGWAETIKVGGTGGAMGVMRLLGDAFEKQHPNINVVVVPGLGSGGGRKPLLGGALDVAATSKALTDVEKTAGTNASLYGRSPFVIAIQEKSKVANVSTKEIVDIHRLKTTHWPDGSRLRLILRPLSDSDTDMLKRISPDMEAALKVAHAREGMKIGISDEDTADAIEGTAGAVGSSVLSLILSEKRALKPLAVNGVTPSVKTISDGSYPWFKSYFLLTRAEPSASAKLFAEFVVSAQARQLLPSVGVSIP